MAWPHFTRSIRMVCLIGFGMASSALAESSDPLHSKQSDPLLEQGRYLAIAADCAACHRSPDPQATPFVGGYAIQTPMGAIYASNITPSKQYGIGDYSEAQFADALRKGIARDGRHLYPAMPYTSYKDITDEDIHALYAFMTRAVPAVEIKAPQTSLEFPFNQRWALSPWNAVFLQNYQTLPKDPTLARGKYLVDALAHCGACHTPRNFMMAEEIDSYLTGASVGGWYAPNLTSDRVQGLGLWGSGEIATYLKSGSAHNRGQAAGGMAEAVEHSLQYLTDSDIAAIVKYLQSLPADPGEYASENHPLTPVVKSTLVDLEPGGLDQPGQYFDNKTNDGALLYNSACATCHQLDGNGTSDVFYPSLQRNSAVSLSPADNLIMTILRGIDRKSAGLPPSPTAQPSQSGPARHAFMPAFANDLNDRQIAAIGTYVLQQFGQSDRKISLEQVRVLRSGGPTPSIVQVARFWPVGLMVAIALLGIAIAVARRRNRTSSHQEPAAVHHL